jgi:hypothetical protein
MQASTSGMSAALPVRFLGVFRVGLETLRSSFRGVCTFALRSFTLTRSGPSALQRRRSCADRVEEVTGPPLVHRLGRGASSCFDH